MIGSAIRELAAADDGITVAAALSSGKVQVWDLSTRRVRTELTTLYSYIGSHSMILARSGDLLITADSLGGRMAAYCVSNGEMLWRRRLPNPDRLSFGATPDRFWYSKSIGGRKPAVECAESKTGKILQTFDGGQRGVEGEEGLLLLETWKDSAPFTLKTASQAIKIPRRTFGLLFAAFTPDSLLLSEAGGPVRCLSHSGETRWIVQPEEGSHVVNVYYNKKDNFAYGVCKHYEKVPFRRLIRFDLMTGKMDVVCDLPGWSECFVPVSEQVVTSEGLIFNLATGLNVGSLDFPMRIYNTHQ